MKDLKIAREALSYLQKYSDIKLSNKSRKQRIVYLRYMYYRIARDKTSLSVNIIAEEVGVSHSSVLSALKKFDYLVLTLPEYADIYHKALDHMDVFMDSEESKLDNTARPVIYRYIQMLKHKVNKDQQ